MSAPGSGRSDFPSHCLDKTAQAFADILIFLRNSCLHSFRILFASIYLREYQRAFYRFCGNLVKYFLQRLYNRNHNLRVRSVLCLLSDETERLSAAFEIVIIIHKSRCICQIEAITLAFLEQKACFQSARNDDGQTGSKATDGLMTPETKNLTGIPQNSFLGYNANGRTGLEGALRATETSCVPLLENQALTKFS